MNPQTAYNIDLSELEKVRNFIIPSLVCQKCRGICDWNAIYTCPLCNNNIILDTNLKGDKAIVSDTYQHVLRFVDVFGLSKRHYITKPIIECMCSNAALFVHFATYTIDKMMLNILEEPLRRGVQVAGVVGFSKKTFRDIDVLNNRYAGICNIIPWEDLYGNKYSLPHQKFIIIDSIIGLAGSMNFTESGFSKHDHQPPFELLWPLTNVDIIITLNNEYLSSLFVPDKALGIFDKHLGDDFH